MDRVLRKKRFPLGKISGVACLAALALFSAYQLAVTDKRPVKASRKAAIKVAAVRDASFQEYFLVDAFVAPFKSVYIDSMEYGIVEGVYVDRGSVVHKGEALLKLRNEELEAQLASRKAALKGLGENLAASGTKLRRAGVAHREELLEIEHRLAELEEDLEAEEELFSIGAASEAELRSTRRELSFWDQKKSLLAASQELELESIGREGAGIRASMEVLELEAARLEERLRKMTVVSPAYGQIADFDASAGETKNVGSRLARIDIMDPLKLKATLDEYYLSRIDVGAKATFTYPDRRGNDGPVELRASWVSSDVEKNSFGAEFQFTGEAPAVKIGQRVVLRVAQGAERRALVLEQGQFYQSSGGAWVFVMAADGRSASKRDIVAGKSNPEDIEILSGLEAGEKVIVSDCSSYSEAERIELK